MSMISVECNRCHQFRMMEYIPNDIISEAFVRACFHCNGCVSHDQRGSKPKAKTMMAPVREQRQASAPYKDD